LPTMCLPNLKKYQTRCKKVSNQVSGYSILGRSDDMIIFRGVNIYPGHADEILSGIKGIGSEYQVILTRGDDGRDYMNVKIERAEDGDPAGDPSLAEHIQGRIRKELMVSIQVEIVNYGDLPRSERKSQRVFDYRT